MLGTIIMILIVVTLLLSFIFGIFWSIYVMFKKAIVCPACGRKFKGAGRQPKCYKCGTQLFKHANGEYMIRS